MILSWLMKTDNCIEKQSRLRRQLRQSGSIKKKSSAHNESACTHAEFSRPALNQLLINWWRVALHFSARRLIAAAAEWERRWRRRAHGAKCSRQSRGKLAAAWRKWPASQLARVSNARRRATWAWEGSLARPSAVTHNKNSTVVVAAHSIETK